MVFVDRLGIGDAKTCRDEIEFLEEQIYNHEGSEGFHLPNNFGWQGRGDGMVEKRGRGPASFNGSHREAAVSSSDVQRGFGHASDDDKGWATFHNGLVEDDEPHSSPERFHPQGCENRKAREDHTQSKVAVAWRLPEADRSREVEGFLSHRVHVAMRGQTSATSRWSNSGWDDDGGLWTTQYQRKDGEERAHVANGTGERVNDTCRPNNGHKKRA
ncbi:hypothetical protein Sjap_001888 [Stephania japonica]|uniref:Uncharacterized protein n=1 Tax=Stephania japonica TaxID=461633 RepID=A0AAP0KKT7_9MAGN